MGQRIELANVPNQALTVELDGETYELEFDTCGDILAVSIVRDDQVLFNGLRVVNGTPLIPYTKLATGNFIFISSNEDLPNWQEFGTTQVLYFLTEEELAAL